MKLFSPTLLLAALLPLLALGQLTVQTQQGNVLGIYSSTKVRRWAGVPYAVAKRWEAPTAPPVRTSTFSALRPGPACFQALTPSTREFLSLVGGAGLDVTESEDCLSLNIWSPATVTTPTAVLLWIHGGGFNFGTSNITSYFGTELVGAHADVTVVSINYRMNIFSHPNAPQIKAAGGAQNFALLDVAAAIDWVHANIAKFGGDPNRITIFGQSAGAAAVDAYSFMFPTNGKVKGLIEQSGTISGRLPTSAALPSSLAAWNAVSTAVGCGTDATAAQLACMKGKSGRELEDAVISTDSAFSIQPDGVTLHTDTTARALAGSFLKVPMLIGTTAEEADIYTLPSHLQRFGGVSEGIFEMQSAAATMLGFTCGAGYAAQRRVAAGVPTWRYLYEGVFPGISTHPYLRAYHAAEIQMVFGTYASATAEQVALSALMQKAWVAFARNPAAGLSGNGIAWPRYDHTGDTLVLLGNRANSGGTNYTKGTTVDRACSAQKQATLAGITAQLATLMA